MKYPTVLTGPFTQECNNNQLSIVIHRGDRELFVAILTTAKEHTQSQSQHKYAGWLLEQLDAIIGSPVSSSE